MENQKHKYDVVVDRIRFNAWGEEVYRITATHGTWAKSEDKAISNVRYRLFGNAMNSIHPDEEVYFTAKLVV